MIDLQPQMIYRHVRKLFACLLLLIIGSATHELQAQSFSVGSAVIYGDDIDQVGVHARAYYNLKGDKICFGPEFSYFPNTTETINGEEVTRSLTELNFNMHYLVELNHKWGLYPLVGLNMSYEREEEEGANGETITENIDAFGANVGFGVHRATNQWIFFAEYDHLFSDLSQNSFLIGVFYHIGKKSEKHGE